MVDGTFLSANLLKLFEGAWAPLPVRRVDGPAHPDMAPRTNILMQKTRRSEVPLETLLASLEKKPPHVVPGTAVFLTSQPEFAPTALLHNLKHNKVLHEHNVILTIITTDTPRATEDERVKITALSAHFSLVALKFGYHGIAERAEGARHRPQARLAVRHHVDVVLPVAAGASARGTFRHARWQDRLFIGLAKSASDATDFFQIPTGARRGGRHPRSRSDGAQAPFLTASEIGCLCRLAGRRFLHGSELRQGSSPC